MTATLASPREPDLATDPKAPPALPNRRWLPWAVVLLGASCFLIGVGSIKKASSVASEWGLIGTASPIYTASIPVVALAFVIAIRQANMKAAVVATVLMAVVMRLPRSIGTDMPMYSWTYKHLGVVDYIQQTQSLARGIDIYMGWPGLFSLTAWFSELTGIDSTSLAHWYPQLFHLVFTPLVFAAAVAWGLKPLAAITATFLVVTFNWVEQDYFSPQSMAMIFAAGVVLLIGLARTRPTAFWLILVLFAAANLTHQLTPYWLFMVIGLLVVTRRLKPWWIIFPLGIVLLTQLAYNWEEVSRFTLFSGDILKNTQSNIAMLADKAARGQRYVSIGNKLLAGGMWAGSALIVLYRWRTKQPFWEAGVLALAGMLILGGQSYGGEAIFRVYLYTLIGCSIVIAPGLVGLLQGRRWRPVVGGGALVVASFMSLNSNTGNWYAVVMPKIQVETARIVLDQAELPAYLTPVAPVWPERASWRYVSYAQFNKNFDYPMIWATGLVGRHFDTDDDYQQFITALYSRPDASTYLIMTDQMRVYAWYFGILPLDALPNLKERLKNDPEHWEPFYEGNGISVFLHKVRPAGAPAGGDGSVLGNSVGTAGR